MSASKRRRRPILLTLFGVAFLLLPFGNYAARTIARRLNPLNVPAVLRAFGLTGALLLVASFAVGVGLLRVRSWGYRLFLAYAVALVAYDVVEVARNPVLYNYGAIAQTLFAFAAVAYFARKDVYKPYLAEDPRGFRTDKRYAFASTVTVDGTRRPTRDISNRGCFVLWAPCPKNVGDAVELTWDAIAGNAFRMRGVVARKDHEGIGIAYEVEERSPESLRGALSAEWRVKGD